MLVLIAILVIDKCTLTNSWNFNSLTTCFPPTDTTRIFGKDKILPLQAMYLKGKQLASPDVEDLNRYLVELPAG